VPPFSPPKAAPGDRQRSSAEEREVGKKAVKKEKAEEKKSEVRRLVLRTRNERSHIPGKAGHLLRKRQKKLRGHERRRGE